jgi:hypothetical protein
MPVKTMNIAGMNNRNIMNNANIINNSVIINNIYKDEYWDE